MKGSELLYQLANEMSAERLMVSQNLNIELQEVPNTPSQLLSDAAAALAYDDCIIPDTTVEQVKLAIRMFLLAYIPLLVASANDELYEEVVDHATNLARQSVFQVRHGSSC